MKSNLRYNLIYLLYCLYELRYGKVLLNNYGYCPTSLTGENAYQLQFYAELLKAAGTGQEEVLDLCEIGCGQGHGGVHLLRNHLHGQCRYIGLDASEVAIYYCKWKHRQIKNALFKVNQEGIPFADEAFDIILSVETGVPRINEQLREVYRCLKPSGKFIVYETYNASKGTAPDHQFSHNGFAIVKKINVTSNIVDSLLQDNARKLAYLSKLWFLPKKIRKSLGGYANIVGSDRFENYYSNKRNGFIYVLQKFTPLMIGYVGAWDGRCLRGWAFCQGQRQPTILRVIVDGQAVYEVVAGLPRRDVAAIHGNQTLNSGFSAPLPLRPGGNYSLRVVSAQTGQELANSPMMVKA